MSPQGRWAERVALTRGRAQPTSQSLPARKEGSCRRGPTIALSLPRLGDSLETRFSSQRACEALTASGLLHVPETRLLWVWRPSGLGKPTNSDAPDQRRVVGAVTRGGSQLPLPSSRGAVCCCADAIPIPESRVRPNTINKYLEQLACPCLLALTRNACR
jgi:hypothetical protein